jgi:ubiquitin carboxyl-terminal hydrolase 7
MIFSCFGWISKTTINCVHVDFTSAKSDIYMEMQLPIKGKKSIDDSLMDYFGVNLLDGNNKYNAGEHGLQEAEESLKIKAFPNVLSVHLVRFEEQDFQFKKIDDRFEFDEELFIPKILAEEHEEPEDQEFQSLFEQYSLQAVISHCGNTENGHYTTYIVS